MPTDSNTSSINLSIEGWMSEAELLWLHETAKSVSSIVELGSWKGRSTYALLTGCNGVVNAVDHWQGNADPSSPNGIQGPHQEVFEHDVYKIFKKNVGMFSHLNEFKMSTKEAAQYFAGNQVDMVFIDAGHLYDEVKSDIETWLPHARKLICGHDWSYPDVGRAVKETFGQYVKLVPNTDIWYVDLPSLFDLLQEAMVEPTDIHDHITTLQSLAEQCEVVTEFGTRTGISTRALAAGGPCLLTSYDVNPFTDRWRVECALRRDGGCYLFIQESTLTATIRETDLLFIDTFHSYGQLIQELNSHAGKVKKYIVMHDTETFAHHGMDGDSRGLVDAFEEFLEAWDEWSLFSHTHKCHGLTVLVKGAEPSPILPPYEP